jgi:2-amino-4-hydroxy-6-hydroxymethyldihydropteridine diphosphokinase
VKTVYIGLGSNLGDSLQVVLESWARLGTVPGICLGKISHPYLTEPVGMDSDNWFVNAVGQLQTSLAPKELLHCMHLIEEQFGRARDSAVDGYQDRVLDLDLLLYGQDVLQGDVHVPHPVMQNRLFVLLPLCEIAPDVQHPVLEKRMGDLLAVLQAEGGHQVVKMTEWSADKESTE